MSMAEHIGKPSLILSYPSKVETKRYKRNKKRETEKKKKKDTKKTKKHFGATIKDAHVNDKLI